MSVGSLHIPRRQTPEQVEALFAAQRTGDPVGVKLHLACGAVACFLAGWPTSFVDWAALPVLICFLVRMTGWHRMLEPLAFDRVLRRLLMWGAWVGLSVLWSAGKGWHEWSVDIRPLRFFALAILLWPVMDRRAVLVVVLLVGIACGQISQIVHLAANAFHWNWIPIHRDPNRISGWWDPVSGGTVLCVGLGLWLAAALFAAGRARVVGAVGVAATLASIALTGTRGAWIGAACLCCFALALAAWRVRPRRRLVIPIAALAAVLVLSGAAAYLLAGSRISQRLDRGIDEVRSALQSKNYSTDTGLRIAMWQWAVAASKEHPIIGVGAGGYQTWVRSQTPETAAKLGAPNEAAPNVHAQAHSVYFHTLATGGLIGLTLLGLLGLGAVRLTLRTAGANWTDLAPALGLVGLACAGLFDTITVNQQPSYLFYLLLPFCLPTRPRCVQGASPVPTGGAA